MRSTRAIGVVSCVWSWVCACSAPSLSDDAVVDARVDAVTADASSGVATARSSDPAVQRAAIQSPGTCLIDTTGADFQAGVLTNCDATRSPGDVTLVLDSPQIDQQNTTVTINGFGFTSTSWVGQTFVPAVSGPVTRIDLDLFCSGCSGTTPELTVSLRATTGTPAIPTGPDLATATIAGFSSSSGGFFTASFDTQATVTAGTVYAVVFRAVASPSVGFYGYLCSCSPNTSPYTTGQRVTSTNSGTTWVADTTSGGRDVGFKIFISSFLPSGTLVSSTKDANPAVGDTVHWNTLSWTASAPAKTGVRFRAAASANPTGPFSFVGPDRTAGTFFTSGDSLSQFDGNRYLKYEAVFATTDSSQTPTLQDVSSCFHNAPTVTTSLAVSPVSGPFGGNVELTAVLTGGGAGLGGLTVSFTLDGTAVGSGTTDAQGTATVGGVSLVGIELGTYPGVVAATYAGEAGFTASTGSSDLTVSRAAQAIEFPSIAGFAWLDGSATLGATASSGLAVSYGVISGPCSISETTLTAAMAGSCVVAADQPGDIHYHAALQVMAEVTVSKVSQTIMFPAVRNPTAGSGSVTLDALATSGLSVSFDVLSGSCNATGSTLTATDAGPCVVAANQPGDDRYSAAPQVTERVMVSSIDDGCACHSSNGGAMSSLLVLVVAARSCRRRRSSR